MDIHNWIMDILRINYMIQKYCKNKELYNDMQL